MERETFVAEGKLESGPKTESFVFLEGDYLGKLLVDRFKVPGEEPGYCNLGRVRISVEPLDSEA